MRFPATLPTPSNVGPILGSPMYSSEYEMIFYQDFCVTSEQSLDSDS